MRSRRFLPSLSLLTAFEAVVRTRSVTVAAKELSLTQSTVSRLIQNLEAQLGQPLFVRERKRLIATEAGEAYARDVSQALDMIQRAGMTLVTNPGGGTLSLAVLPTFGTRWLAPRLSAFLSAHPGVSVNLATRMQRVNFEAEAFDASIHYGDAGSSNLHHLKLFHERLTACVAPDFLARNDIRTLADLSRAPLLKLESRPGAWATWFAGQGESLPSSSGGMLVDHFSIMIQAAIAGLGAALLPHYLAEIEIAEKRLVAAFETEIPDAGAYWLTWPSGRDQFGPLLAFREWLEARGDPSP